MCTRGQWRRGLAAMGIAAALLAGCSAWAQAPEAAATSAPMPQSASSAPLPVAAAPVSDPGVFTDVPPFSGFEPNKPARKMPVKRRAKKKMAAAQAPAGPQDSAPSGGTTHQDPLLLLGVVAFALYRRYHHEDEFAPAYVTLPPDAPELLRNCSRQLANPAILLAPELPKVFRMTSVSWTALVPGAGPMATVPARPATPIAPPPPEPKAQAAAAEKSAAPSRTRVLLVGGEPSWIRFQTDVLRGDGADVEVCDPSHRAVDMLLRSAYDVVMVDAEATGDNSAPVIRRWLARNRPGMEKRLVVSVGNLCDARTSALLEEARALTLTRPCGVQDLLVIVRLAAQRRALAPA